MNNDNSNPSDTNQKLIPLQQPVNIQNLIDMVLNNQILIIKAGTGSGKTTEIPKLLINHLMTDLSGNIRPIICTQPRKAAAIGIAQYVASQIQDKTVSETVGYMVGGEIKITKNKTKLIFATDSKFLTTITKIDDFKKYSYIIIDEAHERTIYMDILMALLKQAFVQDKEFPVKVIIMSATFDVQKYREYFFYCETMDIPGSASDVAIIYSDTSDIKNTKQIVSNAVNRVKSIINLLNDKTKIISGINKQNETDDINISINYYNSNDILVFLPTSKLIDDAIEQINSSNLINKDNYIILKLTSEEYNSADEEKKKSYTQPHDNKKTKIIIATNIAEASLTINGLTFVVDSGLSQPKIFNPDYNEEISETRFISKASAGQRAGRVGRISPGICYRLYTKAQFDKTFQEDTYPDILVKPVDSLVLQLQQLSPTNPNFFNFGLMDLPGPQSLLRSFEKLNYLNAINMTGINTSLGSQIYNTYTGHLDPELAILLINAEKEEYNCYYEMLVIVGFLQSGKNMFNYPLNYFNKKEGETKGDEIKNFDKFIEGVNHDSGDLLTWLNVYIRNQNENPNEYINKSAIEETTKFITDQLKKSKNKSEENINIITNLNTSYNDSKETQDANIIQCLLSGLALKIANKKNTNNSYTIPLIGKNAIIDRSSLLNETQMPEYIIYNKLDVKETKNYMKIVTKITREQLEKFKKTTTNSTNISLKTFIEEKFLEKSK
jgi:HrpA-like RNA helicase